MIPLLVFLLACAAVYLGAIEAAFSALMRLSLRLIAERSGRPGHLAAYLDDPVLLFVPVRLLLGLVTAAATALLAKAFGAATFREVVAVRPGDGPSAMYLERCDELVAAPPGPGWDGVYVMTHK